MNNPRPTPSDTAATHAKCRAGETSPPSHEMGLTMILVSLNQVRDDWKACYSPDRLAELLHKPVSLRDALTRKDGPWADVPDADRVWVACRALPKREAVLFAVGCAERAASREPNIDPWVTDCNAMTRRWLAGNATDADLRAADAAACAAWVAWAACAARAARAARADAAACAARAAWAARAARAARASGAWAEDAVDAAAWAGARSAGARARAAGAREQAQQIADLLSIIDSTEKEAESC